MYNTSAESCTRFYDGYATVLSSFAFGKLIPEAVYQSHAIPNTAESGGDEDKCLGTKCFALTHAIVAGLCLCSSLVAVVLARRVVPTYRKFWLISRQELRAQALISRK